MPINASKLAESANENIINNSTAFSSRIVSSDGVSLQNNNNINNNDDDDYDDSDMPYKLYKVVLNRTELETWDNDNNSDVTIFFNKPDAKSELPAQKDQKNLTICQPDSWSNEWPDVASSLVQTMGSIIDKIEHDLTNGNYLSIVGQTPTLLKSTNETSFDLKESEEESLKSFEINEILNDISDDSINNENLNSSNCDSLKEFKNMEKIVSDSGYMTVHQNGNSRLGISSNDDEESIKLISKEKAFFIEAKEKIVQIPKIIIEQDIDNKKSSQCRTLLADEDLTKVTSMVDSYESDASCDSFSNEDSIVQINEIQSLLDDMVAKCDKDVSNHDNEPFKLNPHEHRSKLRRRRSMLNSLSPHSKSIRHDSDSSSNNDEINKIRNLSTKKSSLSPLKKKSKKTKINSDELIENLKSESTTSPRIIFEDELNSYNENDEEDEFFLAITTDRLETGSCPNIYWYSETGQKSAFPNFNKTDIIKRMATSCSNNLNLQQQHNYPTSLQLNQHCRSKSLDNFTNSTSSKSYENITQNNYIQMVNSMITGAISDNADQEYVEYVKRHIQGLFENFTPISNKSKSNEEFLINSSSREKIVDIVNQSLPKSFSFDLQFLEESKINEENNQDAMDFSKFGLGIDTTANESKSSISNERDQLDKEINKLTLSMNDDIKKATVNDGLLIKISSSPEAATEQPLISFDSPTEEDRKKSASSLVSVSSYQSTEADEKNGSLEGLVVKTSCSGSSSSVNSPHNKFNESQVSYILDEFDNHYKDNLDEEERINMTVVETVEKLFPQRHRSSSFNNEKPTYEEILINTKPEHDIINVSPSSKCSSDLKGDKSSSSDESDKESANEAKEIAEPFRNGTHYSTLQSFEIDAESIERPVARLGFKSPSDEKLNDSTVPEVELSKSGSNNTHVQLKQRSNDARRSIEDLSTDDESLSDNEKENDSGQDGSKSPINEIALIKSKDASDDLIIECKVDYYLKDSDESSSLSETSDSDCESKVGKNSDYDNILTDGNVTNNNDSLFVVSHADTESETLISENNKRTNQTKQLKNDSAPTLAEAEDNEDEDDDILEFNFMDDELNDALDDNWIQEDDIIFGNMINNAMNTQKANFPSQIFQPRVLHRIEEEKSEKSSSESEHVSNSTQVDADDNKLVGFVENIDDTSKLKVKFKYEKKASTEEISDNSDINSDISQNSDSKLRTQLSNIESLLENPIQAKNEIIEDNNSEEVKSESTEISDDVYKKLENQLIDIELEYEKELSEKNNSGNSHQKEFNAVEVLYEIDKEEKMEEEEPVKVRVFSQTDPATEHDASSDFDEGDFSEEDQEVKLIEHNVVANDIHYEVDEAEGSVQCIELLNVETVMDSLAAKAVESAMSKAANVIEKGLDATAEKSVQFAIANAVGKIVLEAEDTELIIDYVENDSDINESSNEAFEINYEFQEEEKALKRVESEIDIANLELKVFNMNEEKSNQLQQVLSQIGRDIDENNSKIDEIIITERPSDLQLFASFDENENSFGYLHNQHGNSSMILNSTCENLEAATTEHIVPSTSWPLINSTQYDLQEENETAKIEVIKPSITADRLDEAHAKYTGSLTKAKLSPRLPATYSTSLTSKITECERIEEAKCDKSYQVNPSDLIPTMIDHQTQMTPPLSPLKNYKIKLPESHVDKVSIGTETDEFPEPIQIVEKIQPISSSTQTFADLENINTQIPDISTLNEKLSHQFASTDIESSTDTSMDKPDDNSSDDLQKKPLVKDANIGIESDLNDEQCLILLHGMKKMDDEFKSELKNLTNEEMTKSELFYLIKNFSTLSKKDRKKLEFLIISNLNKTNNKEKQEDLENTSTETVSDNTQSRQIIKIQNASLDSYLQSLLDDDVNASTVTESDMNEVEAPTEITTAVRNTEFGVPVEITTETEQEIPINTVDSLEPKVINDSSKQVVLKFNHQEDSVRPDSPKAGSHNQLAIANNYNSHFIDLLSLNLDRSKTWVEMTEAKLNYMIGETDAVLRSMCFDSSEEEDEDYEEKKLALRAKKTEQLSIETAPIKAIKARTRQPQQQQQLVVPFSPYSTRSTTVSESETTSSTIQEMTKLYLDSYKRQLQDSKTELNSRMSLLDKEKEKVSRIRDIRKRELYMRRQAAIESFRLERERELNVQINKINELKNEISNEPDNYAVDISMTSFNDESIIKNKLDNSMLVAKPSTPSQNREKLASLRRNLVINSTNNFSNTTTQSDFFGETSNPYYTSILNFDESFIATPRSGRSSYSQADNNPILPQAQTTTTTNAYSSVQRNRNDLNKENRMASEFYASNNYGARSVNSFMSSYERKPDYRPTYKSQVSPVSKYASSSSSSSSPYKSNTYQSKSNDKTLVSTPRSRNVSFTSTPNERNERNDRSYSNSSNYTSDRDRSRPIDTRLLVPVISTMTTTTTTTTANVANDEVHIKEMSNVNSPTPSIVDESKLLLREYEQLRSDSVSEIQRAHDSLNASLKWLENQKTNFKRKDISCKKSSVKLYYAECDRSLTQKARPVSQVNQPWKASEPNRLTTSDLHLDNLFKSNEKTCPLCLNSEKKTTKQQDRHKEPLTSHILDSSHGLHRLQNVSSNNNRLVTNQQLRKSLHDDNNNNNNKHHSLKTNKPIHHHNPAIRHPDSVTTTIITRPRIDNSNQSLHRHYQANGSQTFRPISFPVLSQTNLGTLPTFELNTRTTKTIRFTKQPEPNHFNSLPYNRYRLSQCL